MSLPGKELYAASCNPPRRAKRPRANTNELQAPSLQTRSASASPVVTTQPRPILPKRTAASNKPPSGGHVPSTTPTSIPPTPTALSGPSSPVLTPNNPHAKRGRKPGPLSRSAREAQRRLNHSIIEKARRTKINNALATLKQLVPLDYGKKTKVREENNSGDEDDGDDDDVDDDGEYGGGRKKTKPKVQGKKEEKEREYKLEILVRTVAFMQDLLHRVAILEHTPQVCSHCGLDLDPEQTKVQVPPRFEQPNPTPAHSPLLEDPSTTHRSKRLRTMDYDATESIPDNPASDSPKHKKTASQGNSLATHRLPSISSWLPETLLDPSIFNVSAGRSEQRNKDAVPPLQLPTPPSSASHYSLHPTPTISSASTSPSFAFPISAHSKTLSPTRTPEDESAATMLLQISGSVGSSPTFRPLPPSVFALSGPIPTIPPSLSPSGMRSTEAAESRTQTCHEGLAVQTPGSLLGLISPSATQ